MAEISEANALDVAARMSDPDWPGVVAKLPNGWRLAVNGKGTRYALQRSGKCEGREVWSGRSYSTLAALRAKADVKGLAQACEGLPDRPSEACPALQQRRAALVARFHETDWSRDDYPRVAWQAGNFRVIVTPCGAIYRGQSLAFEDIGGFRRLGSRWQTRWVSACKSELARLMAFNAMGFRGAPGLSPVSVYLREFGALPELASDMAWPEMAQRPETVHGRGLAAHESALRRLSGNATDGGQVSPESGEAR